MCHPYPVFAGCRQDKQGNVIYNGKRFRSNLSSPGLIAALFLSRLEVVTDFYNRELGCKLCKLKKYSYEHHCFSQDSWFHQEMKARVEQQ